MKKSTIMYTENDMKSLREGIQSRYKYYHSKDRVTYPDFEYNSNRANYEHLKNSFEEEIFVLRGINRVKNSIHIPSTSTLVQIFCDNDYVPNKKILNTCRIYAEASLNVVFNSDELGTAHLNTAVHNKYHILRIGLFVTTIFLALAGATTYVARTQQILERPASGLVIERPTNGKVVSRQLLAQGKVSNARLVWLIVRGVKSFRYWVQPPINVEEDGTWRGQIYIGSKNKADVGMRVQVRAFVNPVKNLEEGEELHSWPESQLSSQVLEVVRGPETD